MADDELIEDHERDRFAGTSAMRDEDRAVRDEDRAVRDEDRPMHEPDGDHERGRFARAPESERERADDRTRSS
jgi:hypothetical protein